MIEISAETVNRVEGILQGVPKGAERALSNAINRGLSRIKTTAKKRVKEVYTVDSRALSAASNITIRRASTNDLAGFVSFAGRKIPLYKFKVTPKTAGTKKRVQASVMKGGGATFESAFIADMRNGTGVFERETKKRLPVHELMGLSAAQMVGNQKVLEGIGEEAQDLINERLEHEIDRILNGYGG